MRLSWTSRAADAATSAGLGTANVTDEILRGRSGSVHVVCDADGDEMMER